MKKRMVLTTMAATVIAVLLIWLGRPWLTSVQYDLICSSLLLIYLELRSFRHVFRHPQPLKKRMAVALVVAVVITGILVWLKQPRLTSALDGYICGFLLLIYLELRAFKISFRHMT